MAQTHNENTLGSCNLSEENRFLYFSYLFENDDDNDAQEAKREFKEFSKLPPLVLRLTMTPSLVQQIEQILNGADVARITPCQGPANKVEKLKAVHLPMCSLMIGSYLIEARYPADLVAKFYFARRRLVWEILEKGLKYKIEIQWQNISAIRASIEENKPGNLEIELDTVPSFSHEDTPLRGKRTLWIASSDFTKGCASKYRRHLLRFPAGVLGQHYLRLLQFDKRLFELSRAPFPSSESCYFNSNPNEGTTYMPFGHDLHGSRTTPASEQPIIDPHLLSTQQVNQHGNAMPMSFSAINDLTSPSPASEHQPAFDMPLISTQQVQLYENTMPNYPTSLSLACDQQATSGFPPVSTQQVQLYDNMMPLSFSAMNGPTSLSSESEQQPTFELPTVSTQRVQRHDNLMPLLISATNNPTSLSSACDLFPTFDLPLISTQQPQLYDSTVPLSFNAINDPTSLSSACDQQFAFDLPPISTQQVQLYENMVPLSFNAINDPTSLSSACEQFVFDLPVASTQQVQPYENTMPLSTSATNESTPLSSGICSPTDEAINNQLFQDPRPTTSNPGLDVQRCSFHQKPITFPHNNGSLFIDQGI